MQTSGARGQGSLPCVELTLLGCCCQLFLTCPPPFLTSAPKLGFVYNQMKQLECSLSGVQDIPPSPPAREGCCSCTKLGPAASSSAHKRLPPTYCSPSGIKIKSLLFQEPSHRRCSHHGPFREFLHSSTRTWRVWPVWRYILYCLCTCRGEGPASRVWISKSTVPSRHRVTANILVHFFIYITDVKIGASHAIITD